jgi:FkbM family methyltransferase
MISQHFFTFPFYLPRLVRTIENWPAYVFNYLTRRKVPASYRLRNGFRLEDGTGTLAGTIAVVFVRQEYGPLHDFKTIVDIGANMGSFTINAARLCPRARIFSYEPVEQNFGFLSRNVAINALEDRVTLVQAAVAARVGEMEISLDESPLHSLVIGEKGANRQSVRCTTLEEILSHHNLESVDLLKVNCEGAEYEIFETCPDEILRRIANIRLEYHNLAIGNRNGDALADLLRKRGYQIERFTRYKNVSGFIWASRKH